MRIELRRPVDTPTGVKHVIHNYGHGGGGVSLAFGAAETARELVQIAIETGRHGNAPTSFAVIGAGVIGLTTALAVRERWPSLPLTIYAQEVDCERTTSWLAGGQFANPASLPEYYSDAEQATMTRHLAKSEQRFRDLGRAGLHAHYGIARRVSYSMASSSYDVRLRLGGAMRSARSYESWLIDPTRLLPALNRDLAAREVAMVERTFVSLDDIYALPEPIVINCAGLGARDLFGDTRLQGRRGHLVRLPNPRKLGYFLTSWCGSGAGAPRYLFARHDDIVIGGSILPGREEGAFDPDNPGDVATCQRILRNARGLFETNGAICG